VPSASVEETDAVQKEEPGPVEKSFRPYDPNQVLLLPPSLEEWLPERHLARFVSELVEEALNLSAIRAAYTEERGYPPYDPRLMVKLLIYGYCTGQRSSRVIEKRCWDDVGFRYLAAGAAPDYRSIARFRRRHLEALAGLFLQALQLCQQAGMVRLGKVALDGTKLRANASRHKAMSYQRMVEREKQLEAEIDAMLAEAERVDRAEDERFGPDGRDDDLPEELNRRVDRLLKIQEAKQALEEEARRAAAEKAAERAQAQDLDEQAKEAKVEAAASKAVPKPKAQRNFTDPDARIDIMAGLPELRSAWIRARGDVEEVAQRENLHIVREHWDMGGSGSHDVTKGDIDDVVSKWTGIPITAVKEEESAKLLRMEEELHKRIVSQENAISAVARAIRWLGPTATPGTLASP